MNVRSLALCALTHSCALATAACGGTTVEPAGKDAGPAMPVTQNGIVVDYETQKPIAGATVTAANQTATTDGSGAYSFTIDSGEPYRVAVTAPGYAKLLFQEREITTDYNEGVMNLVSKDEANTLTAAYDGYDASLGVLSVEVIAGGSCATEEGATVTLSDASGKAVGNVMYFANRYPSPGQRSVVAGQLPSAALYNVPPGVPLSLSVTHPTCKAVPYPTVQSGVEYTGGGLDVEAGLATTYVSVFLE